MGLLSSIGSFCSSVGSAIVSGVSAAYNAAKAVAGKAIGWMADKAEGFVRSVKSVWKAVKPYVEKAQVLIKAAAKSAPHPWLKSALLALDAAITALTAFEKSPIAKKIDAAIKWAIKLAKRLQSAQAQKKEQEDRLSKEELAEAEKHQATFRTIENELDDETTRHSCELAASINDFLIAKTKLAAALEGEPADFEHYLRLRATQKLLKMADKTFHTAKSIDDIDADKLFLVRIASNLVKQTPELSMDAAKKLDRILQNQYGTTLAPFVFEEMVGSWGAMAESLDAQWSQTNKELSQMNVAFKSLTLNKEFQGKLGAEEEQELSRLATNCPLMKSKLEDLDIQRNDIARYVGAIEGFLQLLEKSEEQIKSDGHGYLLNDGKNVGMILMRCAQEGVPFDQLDIDEQDLITDYANIFNDEASIRMKRVLEIAV